MGSASRTIISTTGTLPLMYNQTRVLDEIKGAPYMFFLAGIGIVALALLYLYIYYSASWNNRGALWLSDGKLAGQTVVVTGATSGIGRETAIELSRRGARLILVCRDLSCGQDVAGEIRSETMGDVQVEQCDLASLPSVRLFAAKMLETEAKVDCLINCAAVKSPPERKTADGHEFHIGVNYLAPLLLTWLLQPLLKRATPGPARVVCVSCSQYTRAGLDLETVFKECAVFNPETEYARSKLCLVLASKELAHRLESARINVYLADPGLCHTNLSRHIRSGLISSLQNLIGKLCLPSPSSGAQTVVFCALEKSLEEQTGLYYKECKPVPFRISEDSGGRSEQLWTATVALLGIV